MKVVSDQDQGQTLTVYMTLTVYIGTVYMTNMTLEIFF